MNQSLISFGDGGRIFFKDMIISKSLSLSILDIEEKRIPRICSSFEKFERIVFTFQLR